jgi:hypothetical protein
MMNKLYNMKQLKIAIKELDEVAPQRGIPISGNLGGDETVTE